MIERRVADWASAATVCVMPRRYSQQHCGTALLDPHAFATHLSRAGGTPRPQAAARDVPSPKRDTAAALATSTGVTHASGGVFAAGLPVGDATFTTRFVRSARRRFGVLCRACAAGSCVAWALLRALCDSVLKSQALREHRPQHPERRTLLSCSDSVLLSLLNELAKLVEMLRLRCNAPQPVHCAEAPCGSRSARRCGRPLTNHLAAGQACGNATQHTHPLL